MWNTHIDFKTYPDFRVVNILKIFILGVRVYSHLYNENIVTFTNIFNTELFKIANWYLNECLKLDKHLIEVYQVYILCSNIK